MAELFQHDRSVIGKHVRNVFKEGELVKDSVWAKFAYTAADGKTYNVNYYNLDVIISVGYRIKSIQGTQFRIWATDILKEYMLQWTMNDSKGMAVAVTGKNCSIVSDIFAPLKKYFIDRCLTFMQPV